MARDDGFVRADVATDYMDDEKVRHLYRLLAPDSPAMTEAVTVHLATVLASWREGRRVTVHQAAPLWLPVREEILAALVTVGLLDRSYRVPAASWRVWFEPAMDRRKVRQEAGRSGGLAKAKRSSSNALAELELGSTQPYQPAIPANQPTIHPSSRSSRRASSGGAAATPRGGSPKSFREAMADAAASAGIDLPAEIVGVKS